MARVGPYNLNRSDGRALVAPGRTGIVVSMHGGAATTALVNALAAYLTGYPTISALVTWLGNMTGALLVDGKAGAFFAGGAANGFSQLVLQLTQWAVMKVAQNQSTPPTAPTPSQPSLPGPPVARNSAAVVGEVVPRELLEQAMAAQRNAPALSFAAPGNGLPPDHVAQHFAAQQLAQQLAALYAQQQQGR